MTPLARAARLWRTVIHLRPIQIYGRFWFRLNKVQPDLSPPPPLRPASGPWQDPPQRGASMDDPGSFRFFGLSASPAITGWDNPNQSKLWRYNLHYFDDLNAVGWPDRADWHQQILAEWMTANPPAAGSGWEPYPLSLRIVNWCKWTFAGGQLSEAAVHSLAVQARALAARLEWHLLGNHLFANAKALLFAGFFFAGEEADRWRSTAVAILTRELDEQFLTDGAQFELSPMYHALAVEDLLDMLNLAGRYPELLPPRQVQELRRRAADALRWLADMCHPDGGISFFNDAAFGIAPDAQSLESYAAALGIVAPAERSALQILVPSGYARGVVGPAVLLFDAAAVGPSYLPGHAHADTLSFELSLFGQRLFVNSGTGEYGEGPERQRQRGTPAHNSVTIAGQNSSETWGGFRVGRRARVRDFVASDDDGVVSLRASHDGYRFLPGRPVHQRSLSLTRTGLTVMDRVSTAQSAEARFHLHPDVAVEQAGAVATLVLPQGQRIRISADGGLLRWEDSSWHPRFGESIANRCLILSLVGGAARLTLDWG